MKHISALVLMAVMPSALLAQAQPAQTTPFRVVECPFSDPTPSNVQLSCRYLRVPETRGDPASRTIDVAVAIAEPLGARSDPVLLLPGGPGGAPLPRFIERARQWIPEDRSLIVFDPRGTGFSGGPMCPELSVTYSEIAALDLSRSDARALRNGAQRACRNRLQREGVDLDAYNSETVAQDLVDLRRALGIERWNLLAVSYGVPFARELMRRDPDGVRSSILALGPSPDLTQLLARDVPFFRRSLIRVSAGCAQAPACAEQFPDVESDFEAVVDSLRDKPITVNVEPSRFRLRRFTVNAQDFAQIIYWLLMSEQDVAYLPSIIRAFAERDAEVVRAVVEDNFGGLDSDFSSGMALSVMCYDAATPNSEADWSRSAVNVPDAFAELEFFLSHCPFWSEARAPDEVRRPARLSAPTLVITGEYDPMNPPVVGDEHVETLPLGVHVTIPGMGHMPRARSRPCWSNLIRSFVLEPSSGPDIQCTKSIRPVEVSPDLPERLRVRGE